MKRETIVRLLRSGAMADIWYDAKAYGEEGNAAFIARVQEAMDEAANRMEAAMNQTGKEFFDHIVATMPKEMDVTDITAICGMLIASHSPTTATAELLMMEIAKTLREFYESRPMDECMCPACVEKRKKITH